jgi:outer membrane protein insertion porin family
MTVVSILLMLSMAVVQPQNPPTLQTPDPNRIESVRIDNNRRIPSDTIRYNLQTKAGDKFNPEVIRRDIKTLYGLQFFDDIKVSEEEGKTGKIVVFWVKEKPLVRSITYKGNKSITNSEILEKLREKKVGLSQESPYDPTRVKKAEGVIKLMLAEKGRQDATVEATTELIPPNAIGVTFNIDEGPKIKIEKIDIQGNTVFSDGKVKRSMKLIKEVSPITAFTSKDTYYDLKLADDITRIRMLYAENGYVRANVLDPKVETKTKKTYRTLPFIRPPFPFGIPIPFWRKTVDRFYITIKIEENDQYRVGDVRVTGSKEFSEDVIKAVLGLQQGAVFNETLLRKGFENLKKLYGSRGYINFTPVPQQDFDEGKKLVNLVINVDEDRQFYVNRIAFSGNTTTRDKVIRREVMVEEGNVFNSALWDVSLQRLNQLGYFEELKPEDAEVKPQPVEPKVDINLKVKEKNRNSISFNGGVSGIGGSFLGLGYETNNFLGFGETFGVQLQGGTRQSQYQFNFTEPYLFDRPITSGFTVFSTNFRYDQAREFFGLNPNQLPSGLGFENRLNFEQKRAGFSVFTSYPFKIWNRVGLNYGWDNSETSAINPATEEYFNAVRTQENQSFISGTGGSFSKFHARKLIPSYSFNGTRGSALNPSGGMSLSSTFEFTGGPLGGNVNYFRPTMDFRYFHPMNKGRNTLALRILTSHVQGFSNTAVPFYERFFLGGDFDIRGFDFRAVSPIASVVRNIATVDPETGNTINRPFDDIVYVGGDTQGVANLEYRIPLVGNIVIMAPFLDVGNTWVLKKDQLRREFIDSEGVVQTEGVKFLPGTNSGIRTSTGVEFQVMMPVINAPFRLIFAFNPNRIDRTYLGTATGLPFHIFEKGREFKFTVGRTF